MLVSKLPVSGSMLAGTCMKSAEISDRNLGFKASGPKSNQVGRYLCREVEGLQYIGFSSLMRTRGLYLGGWSKLWSLFGPLV